MGFSQSHSRDLSPRQFPTTCQLLSLSVRQRWKWDSDARLHKIRIPCVCLITALGRIRHKSLPRSAERWILLRQPNWLKSDFPRCVFSVGAPKTRERCQKAHLIKLTPNWKIPCAWERRSSNFGCRRCMRVYERVRMHFSWPLTHGCVCIMHRTASLPPLYAGKTRKHQSAQQDWIH